MPKTTSIGAGEPEPLGVTLRDGGANVAVVSENARKIDICLFDKGGRREIARLPLARVLDTVFCGFVSGLRAGARYGLRADGPWDPPGGHWFDPAKLLVDPYATALDRPFAIYPDLAAPRLAAIDTASLVPKAIVAAPVAADPQAPRHSPGFIYEIGVRAFTRRHPAVPEPLRGTIAALAHPAIIDHLVKLGVDTVELMPIAAWIDERHLPRLRLSNAWGYNPVALMAPDPRLAPGGVAEVRAAVAALHGAGIAVILDAVFNHSGESDVLGPTLSFRGLDNTLYYRHAVDGDLVNDTGTGNTLAVERPPVTRLVLDAMRHWIAATGVDGFRLDLAATLGRTADGFSKNAPILAAIEADPVLGRCTMIAEPWDIGPGGHQLGNFPPRWREWNDRFRDDVRRFWRGDAAATGTLATRLAGSSDVFAGRRPSASVNFVAAHDGFTLADLVAHEQKHNQANGEDNRDGAEANLSWNNGVEGPTDDPLIAAARRRDVRALLATLFLSRGTPMLTAGDEFGRGQHGNNNAYAQDNTITWLDWTRADAALIGFTARLAALRRARRSLNGDRFLTGAAIDAGGIRDVVWLKPGGEMRPEDWDAAGRMLGAAFYAPPAGTLPADQTVVWINGEKAAARGWLPESSGAWWREIDSSGPERRPRREPSAQPMVSPRSVNVFSVRPGRRPSRGNTPDGP